MRLKEKIDQRTITSTKLHRLRRIYLNSFKDITFTHVISPHLAYQFRGDFYGILNELKVPASIHALTLEVNDLVSSTMYNGNKNIVLIKESMIPLLRRIKDI